MRACYLINFFKDLNYFECVVMSTLCIFNLHPLPMINDGEKSVCNYI